MDKQIQEPSGLCLKRHGLLGVFYGLGLLLISGGHLLLAEVPEAFVLDLDPCGVFLFLVFFHFWLQRMLGDSDVQLQSHGIL